MQWYINHQKNDINYQLRCKINRGLHMCYFCVRQQEIIDLCGQVRLRSFLIHEMKTAAAAVINPGLITKQTAVAEKVKIWL